MLALCMLPHGGPTGGRSPSHAEVASAANRGWRLSGVEPCWSLAVLRGRFAAALLADRFAVQVDAVRVVHQTVHDAVGDAGIADLFMPARNRQLRGQNRGAQPGIDPGIAFTFARLPYLLHSFRPLQKTEQVAAVLPYETPEISQADLVGRRVGGDGRGVGVHGGWFGRGDPAGGKPEEEGASWPASTTPRMRILSATPLGRWRQ